MHMTMIISFNWTYRIKILIDSIDAIDALLCESPSLADYGHLIDKAKELAKEFMDVEFSHILRQSNSVAHNIARRVHKHSVWMKDVPSHLYSIIQADSASIWIKLQCYFFKKKINWISSITCLKRTNENPFILNQHIFFRVKPFLLFFLWED